MKRREYRTLYTHRIWYPDLDTYVCIFMMYIMLNILLKHNFVIIYNINYYRDHAQTIYNKMCVADHGAGFDMHMLVARSACIHTYTSIQ